MFNWHVVGSVESFVEGDSWSLIGCKFLLKTIPIKSLNYFRKDQEHWSEEVNLTHDTTLTPGRWYFTLKYFQKWFYIQKWLTWSISFYGLWKTECFCLGKLTHNWVRGLIHLKNRQLETFQMFGECLCLLSFCVMHCMLCQTLTGLFQSIKHVGWVLGLSETHSDWLFGNSLVH